MIAIFKKELSGYFKSMIGYIFLGFFVLIMGRYFVTVNVVSGSPIYNDTLISSLIIFLFLVPALTMRLFAEEARQKTDQLLYTSPITVTGIVTGKFFAALALFLIAVGITLIFPFILTLYGDVPLNQIFIALLGFVLMGGCFISVGLFVSVLTDNQIIAAVATFAALFFIFMINAISVIAPMDVLSSVLFVSVIIIGVSLLVYGASKAAAAFIAAVSFLVTGAVYLYDSTLFDGLIYKTLEWFSVLNRFESFYMGILNVSDIVYYITFSAVFIYLTISVIEKRRWS